MVSPKPLCQPVGDHLQNVVLDHDRCGKLRIVGREAVSVVHEEMVEVREYAGGHIFISALLECGFYLRKLLGHRLLVT